MDTKSYLDFAEDDYKYFKFSVDSGYTANAMAALAQNCCEKYLKHLIDRYIGVNEMTADERELREDVLKTHSLRKIMQYIQKYTAFPKNIQRDILLADGFYFSARYPGDDSIEVSKEDIEDCKIAVSSCRQYTVDKCKELSSKTIQSAPIEKVHGSSINEQLAWARSQIQENKTEDISLKEKEHQEETEEIEPEL